MEDCSPQYMKCLNPICDWVGRDYQLIEGGRQQGYLGQYCPKCWSEQVIDITEEEFEKDRK